jgi:hypothetical protein
VQKPSRIVWTVVYIPFYAVGIDIKSLSICRPPLLHSRFTIESVLISQVLIDQLLAVV